MPEIDDNLAYLWGIYLELHSATSGQVTYQEIQAYCQFNGDLTPFEVDAIMTMSKS